LQSYSVVDFNVKVKVGGIHLTMDTQKSAFYLDLYIEIDNGVRFKIKFDDKRDDVTVPIVTLPCIRKQQ
jgi:hypothetical protein